MADTPSSYDPLAQLHHIEKLVEARVTEAIKHHQLENKHDIDEIRRTLDNLAQNDIHLEALIRSGFPGDDPPSHRRVHEKYIVDANERAALVKTTKEKIVASGTWGAVVLVAMAVWDYIKAHLK